MDELPVAVSLVLVILTAAAVIWILAEAGRRTVARGTRQRYVYATFERSLRYPALVYLTVSSVLNFRFGDPLMGCLTTVGVALWISLWVEKQKNGEDDDFWTHLRARIESWGRKAAPVEG